VSRAMGKSVRGASSHWRGDVGTYASELHPPLACIARTRPFGVAGRSPKSLLRVSQLVLWIKKASYKACRP